jgi:hypothetical protein
VTSQSQWVSFHPERLDSAVAQWGHLAAAPGVWSHPCHYCDGLDETVRWIFILDVLNHCFWPDLNDPVWAVVYQGKSYSGYWGLAASLRRAIEAGLPVTKADYLADIPDRDLGEIFAGEGSIPMFAERLSSLREAGRVLQNDYGGDIVNLIREAEGCAVRVVTRIVSSFSSFRDEARYKGKIVYFWKRAQLFVSDLYLAFGGKGWGDFHDIEELTAFADYKLPQVLRELGIISYHPHLAQAIDNRVELKPGGEEETEIRAMTILAVDAFKKAFLKAGRVLSSNRIDNWLWQLGQLEPFRRKPYHRCRTIFY